MDVLNFLRKQKYVCSIYLTITLSSDTVNNNESVDYEKGEVQEQKFLKNVSVDAIFNFEAQYFLLQSHSHVLSQGCYTGTIYT